MNATFEQRLDVFGCDEGPIDSHDYVAYQPRTCDDRFASEHRIHTECTDTADIKCQYCRNMMMRKTYVFWACATCFKTWLQSQRRNKARGMRKITHARMVGGETKR